MYRNEVNRNWIFCHRNRQRGCCCRYCLFSFNCIKVRIKTINTTNGPLNFCAFHNVVMCLFTQFDESVRLLGFIKILSEATAFFALLFFVPCEASRNKWAQPKNYAVWILGLLPNRKQKSNLNCRFDFLGSLSIIFFCFVHSLALSSEPFFCLFFLPGYEGKQKSIWRMANKSGWIYYLSQAMTNVQKKWTWQRFR